MKNLLRHSVMWLLAFVVMFALPALANEPVRFTTGMLGGTYHDVIGVNLRGVMREQGTAIEVLQSRGSVDNLNNINSGDADIGLTQGDALAGWLRQQPTAEIDVLGGLGQECLFMATHKDSGIESIRDLKSGDQRIAVGEQGTGSAQSWNFVTTLNADYREPQVFFQGGVRTLGQVKTGQLDAFLWVSSPENRSHRFLEAVLTEGSDLRFVEFNDNSLAATLPNGQEVYTTGEILGRKDVGIFKRDEYIDTLCTDLLVVGDYNLDGNILENTATAVMMNANRIMGR